MLSRRLMKATPSAASSARALTRCFRDRPNVVDGIVYVGSVNGNVYAFGLK
jgi:outer membrane protein assembly factor BamB